MGKKVLLETPIVGKLVKSLQPGSAGLEEGRRYFAVKKQEIGRKRLAEKRVQKAGRPGKMLSQDEAAMKDVESVEGKLGFVEASAAFPRRRKAGPNKGGKR